MAVSSPASSSSACDLKRPSQKRPVHASSFQDWVSSRLDWMDENLPGAPCGVSGVDEEIVGALEIYPNPARDYMEVETEEAGVLRIVDVWGREVMAQQFDPGSPRISLKGLMSGVYVVSLEGGERVFRGKVVVER
jgi:hypothetical protein